MVDDFRRILVVATRQIGDVLLTTPLIGAAQRRWPAARIDVLGFAGTLGVLRGNPAVHSLIEVEPGAGWLRSLPLAARLWKRYDLALITDGGDRAHLYGWIAARTRSGLVPDRASVSWWKLRLLQHAVMVDSSVHVVVEKGRLLAPWLAPAEDWSVEAPPDTALPADVERLLATRPVVVHVPSMQRYKQWPLEHYRTVVRALVDAGHQVVLTGGPAASDRASVAEVCAVAESPHVLDLSGRLDFAQLATLLRRAALYIGPDTSVTHLAAACGTATIALFGPTPPERWGPWPAGARSPAMPPGDISAPGYQRRAESQRVGRVILLQGPGACVPCGRAGCEDRNDSRSDCLDRLGPERVIAQALRVLDGVSVGP